MQLTYAALSPIRRRCDMAEKMANLDTLHKAVKKMRPHLVDIRVLAVAAELEERAKAKREATQDEIARRYGASGRMLRYWVRRYMDRGLEGLEDDEVGVQSPGIRDRACRE